jgi:glutamine cyclotransferase
VLNVNELEFVKGELLSNIWQQEFIARINPDTGKVTGWVDLRGLLTPREMATADVLNGIAYDEEHDRLFVTGKLWPKIFEIRITNKDR